MEHANYGPYLHAWKQYELCEPKPGSAKTSYGSLREEVSFTTIAINFRETIITLT